MPQLTSTERQARFGDADPMQVGMEYSRRLRDPMAMAEYWRPTFQSMLAGMNADPGYAARVTNPADIGYNQAATWLYGNPGMGVEDYFTQGPGQAVSLPGPAPGGQVAPTIAAAPAPADSGYRSILSQIRPPAPAGPMVVPQRVMPGPMDPRLRAASVLYR